MQSTGNRMPGTKCGKIEYGPHCIWFSGRNNKLEIMNGIEKAPSPGRLAKRRSIQCFAVPLLLPGIARPLCAVSQNAHAQPAPRRWGQPAFAQNGEQPDRITVSIPAQPTLSKHGPDTARIWTVQPAAPRPVRIPPGAVFHPRESWAHRSNHRLKSSQQQLSAARRGMRVPFHRICRFFIKLPCPKKSRPAGAPFGGPKAFYYYTRNGRGLSRPVFQRRRVIE